MTQYIKKLPAVFQTVTEKKFFDATFDQVFSKKDSDYLAGYLGRRNPGNYNPISDFYLPEPSKNRTWWQLEPTAFARNADTSKTNIFFYDDLLEHIEYYGGNTLNQDRLFNSEYYSFGPPIDYDMFINYHDYYWVEQGLPTITITGVLASDIIGKTSYTTPATATPANLTLSTGMKILLADDPVNVDALTVQNMGGCSADTLSTDSTAGIQLIPQFSTFTSGTTFEFLPWDGSLVLSNGRVIDNHIWDILTWDTQAQPSTGDYITIERGSVNRNAWSRTNKWYHKDTIEEVIRVTGQPFPTTATRGLRPIIQFNANTILYKSGTQFRSDISYGFTDNAVGMPFKLQDFQGQNADSINVTYGININNGDLVAFFNDDTIGVNQNIFVSNITSTGILTLTPVAPTVVDGDIVLILENAPYTGAKRGETWYYNNGIWQKAYNDKASLNQSPLFQLYDHNGVPLDDTSTYPDSTFRGSNIFSYKVNPDPGATVDPVLRFPIVYTSLGQATDIVFQNNLIVDRYKYADETSTINGYYYYKNYNDTVLYNGWNLYQPCICNTDASANCLSVSKQRVIDKYVVGYGTEYQFLLSVVPYGYPLTPDLVVSVNGKEVKSSSEETNGYLFTEINNRIYVDLSGYLSALYLSIQSQAPVVEIQTYTHGNLNPNSAGYFEIPQQLDANANQEEVGEISGSNLIPHFTSIIGNQQGFKGLAFGGTNNYRDTVKNNSVGTYILQNTAPLLKSMLVSSSNDLSLINGLRFSQDEYTKFKNKFLRTALELINQEFDPAQYYNNTVVLSLWVDEILKIVSVSKEFSDAFAYSYMIANGSPFATESISVPLSGTVLLSSYIDLTDQQNALYLYDVTGQERLLTIGKDYNIVSTNLVIEIEFTNSVAAGNDIYVALYKNPLPAYIPSTPSKLGTYPTFVPRIEWDTTYVNPTYVVIGHDGSKTIVYGDYRDQLLLELETRIYNLIQTKFRSEYRVPMRIESVREGFFNTDRSRYTRTEYLDITESYLNKWSAKNKANYRANDWDSASLTAPVDKLWKLYNYRLAEDTLGNPLNLPGNWKGIFQYMYDTYNPDTRPWEMLGFSQEPAWWRTEYGNPVLNAEGQEVWGSAASGLHNMYDDLESGIVRQGSTAIYSPITGEVLPQVLWARPGLSNYIPVDAAGEIVSVMTMFDVVFSGNPYEPFDGYDAEWIYGDGSPVEQAWMSTSAYAFTVQEILFLTRPGPYGELMWDTVGTELSPGTDSITGQISNTNWQYVQNDTYSSDEFVAWMRPKNSSQIVHAELINAVPSIRYGYQRWISDRILFLGKDIADTFGQKVRTLDVNLANKLAGFTNKDTTNTYIESVSPGTGTNSLIIPSNNFDVVLHRSPVVDTYVYSGVIIRALADGTFAVYGYDLLSSEFIILDRSTEKLIDITVGGTPAEFLFFTPGTTYNEGDIVRYNGVYYVSLSTQLAQKFEATVWQRLKGLPTVGGVSVSYKPYSAETVTKIPYGHVFRSAQEVFDFLIGWGAYLEFRGWKFDEVNADTNQLSDWLASAKQFLFWLNSSWAPDASIQLSPLANKATLVAGRGYPNDVESISNGVYSILDKFGIAIAPENTITDRDGRLISVEPANLASGGIYFLQINVSETEHALIFDNSTSFNDVIYSPLLRARQQRIKFNGFRSNNWYGKMEAPGYLVVGDQLVPNYDTIVDAMRYYYDPNTTIDNPSLEDLGRHLIGYESKSYLDNLQLSNDVQYLFYKGAIRQKGTKQALDKLFRSTKLQTDETFEIYEEWALKLGDFGNTVEQVSTEFILAPEQNTGEIVVARLNFKPSEIGFVKQINILNATQRYTTVPTVVIDLPDATPPVWRIFSITESYNVGDIVRYDDAYGNPVYYSSLVNQAAGPFVSANWDIVLETRVAKAYIILDSNGVIARADITDPGFGYTSPPGVAIVSVPGIGDDRLYSVWQGAIEKDETLDNIVEIDIDQTNVWTVRPNDPSYSLEFPSTKNIDYPTPNAGYVNFNDVSFSSFDPAQTTVNWGTLGFDPIQNTTVWIAKTFTEDWNVYKLVNIEPEIFDVISDESNNLYLRTSEDFLIQSQYSGGTVTTDFGNIIVLQVTEELAEATVLFTPYTEQATATADIEVPAQAEAILGNDGTITDVIVLEGGSGYITAPDITIEPPIRENASATADVANGMVTNIRIADAGLGYESATVNIDAPVVINATASAQIIDGRVDEIEVINNGLGYFSLPDVTIDKPGKRAKLVATISNGRVNNVDIEDAGSGYVSVPLVTVTPPLLIQASGVGNISNGQVSSITMNTVGAGYVIAPNIEVAMPPHAQASATASVSSGAVVVSLNNGGMGYVTAPGITITGDGTGASFTATVSNGVITGITGSGGTGYTTVSIDIDPPTSTRAEFTCEITNGVVSRINRVSGGSGYITPVTAIFDPPTGIAAVVTVSISEGSIYNVTYTSGSGYSTPPVISVAEPNGIRAEGTAVLLGGQVVKVNVTNQGSGYTEIPKVTIAAPTVLAASVDVSDITIEGTRVINIDVTDPGIGYVTSPTVTISPANGTRAEASSTISAGSVVNISVINGGSGYSSVPQVTIADSPNSGELVGYTIDNPGVYTYKPNVTVVGDGTGAAVEAVWDPVTGEITSLIILEPGQGYTYADIIIDAPDPVPNINNTGQVVGIDMTNEGSGYDKVPTITIVDSAQPAATATVESGSVTAIDIVHPGFGFLTPPAVIITGDGVGATATAVISDYKIVSFTITDAGAGYTYAVVSVAGVYPAYGTGATAQANILDGKLIGANITSQGTGYIKPVAVISEPTDFDPSSNYAVGISFDRVEAGYNYYELVTLAGEQITGDLVDDYENFNRLLLFKDMRFLEEPVAGSIDYIKNGDKIWIDFGTNSDIASGKMQWQVKVYNEEENKFITFREQTELIDSNLFQNASIFDSRTTNKLALLPVYDPFKNIMPAPAIQNISYMTLKDPARYNVTSNAALFSENITFGEAQVGQLWWDLSSAKYVYYEQPIALDGSETYTDNLVYRRDNWGNLFPGSTVAIYEWVKSSVPPEQYTGTGEPRDVTTYVEISTSNRFTNTTETNYYFWVLNPTDKPAAANRTIAANDVARLLESPKSQNYAFFAPIQETDHNNSYIFYNVQETLAYRGDRVQIQYRLSEREDQEHTQWQFFREGDTLSPVTKQYWDKLVDSLCGYTDVLPLSNEYSNSIIVETSPGEFGEILPVPDPTLSESEKYGIQVRPRQSMFVKLQSARKILVQAGNELLQYIPVRDDNPSWNTDVTSNIYWEYTNWYRVGYEGVVPNTVFMTLAEATAALTNNLLQVGDIIQVVEGTTDGRFVLYAVTQFNPNINILSLEEVGIENSAIKLLDIIYTSVNRYDLAVELRQLMTAFRTQVMIDENEVDQNKLFFSLINYVLSEQRNPDWVFKSSYIYIKENNLPVTQNTLYQPDKVDNVIQYINDVKPYHTQIRDYASKYTIFDLADGTAYDWHKIKTTIKFGPDDLTENYYNNNFLNANFGWDFNQGIYQARWDTNYSVAAGITMHHSEWSAVVKQDEPDKGKIKWFSPYLINNNNPTPVPLSVIDQFVSGNPVNADYVPNNGDPWPSVITVDITDYDDNRKGYSNLYPYVVDYNSFGLNNPQTVVTPENIVAIQISDTEYLTYGQDYYVEFDETNNDYVIFFFNDPSVYLMLRGIIWFDGGQLQNVTFNTYRNELGLGFPRDNFVVNVDTKLPVNDVSGLILGNTPATFTAPYAPLVGWGDVWDVYDQPVISDIITDNGGTNNIPWDVPLMPVLLDNTISYKQNLSKDENTFVRNADQYSLTLVNSIDAPTIGSEHIDEIVVTGPTDVLPNPSTDPGVIWVEGERIEYLSKEVVAPNVWSLKLVRRGTQGTTASAHEISIPSLADPLILVPNPVWVEAGNILPGDTNITVWSASDTLPDLSTEGPAGKFTSVNSVPTGGLWYSGTQQSMFLKQNQGKALP